MTSPLPEPRDVGPIAGGHLRASDADRDQVSQVLGTAFAEGRITAEEHGDRLDEVMRARTFDELIPITRDLIPDAPISATPATTRTGDSSLIDTSKKSEPDRLVAIFGGASRTGPYRMRRTTSALAAFGGVELDLTDAVFEAAEVELSVVTFCGGIEVKVPEGVVVRDQTMGILGGAEIQRTSSDPDGPVIILKGVNMLGGTSVYGPKKKKSKKKGHE